MADTVLYQERQLFPWRMALWFLVAMTATCLGVILVGGDSLKDGWWLFLVGWGTVAFWFGWIGIAYRVSPIILDAKHLRIPWRPAIELQHIGEVRVVEGKELKRIRKELQRGLPGLPAATSGAALPGLGLAGLNLGLASMVWRMRSDSVIKGLVADTGARTAMYMETDASTGLTNRWLIGTKHPREFSALLEDAIAHCGRDEPGLARAAEPHFE